MTACEQGGFLALLPDDEPEFARDLDKLRKLRGDQIGMVYQDPMQALNPYLSIGAQLSRVLVHHDIAAGRAARDRVIEMLERVGLPDAQRQFRAYPHELSGGMRQRAMIASALLCEPDLLIADEPTTALDVTVQAQILDLLDELRHDTALLLITHDLGVVAGRCERMVVLDKGRVVEEGGTREVFAAPAREHTRALLEAARANRDVQLEPPLVIVKRIGLVVHGFQDVVLGSVVGQVLAEHDDCRFDGIVVNQSARLLAEYG